MDNNVTSNLDIEKGKIKQKFASLTNNDSLFEEGKKDEMKGRYEISISQIKKDLNEIISSLFDPKSN